jgi:hypothetical protein
MKQTFTYLVAAVLGFLSPSLSSQAQNFNGVFKEVTSQADFTEGYYVIAHQKDTHEFIALIGENDKHRGEHKELENVANGITTNPPLKAVWKIEKTSDGKFTVWNEQTKKYLAPTGKKNQLTTSTTPYPLTIDTYTLKGDRGHKFTLRPVEESWLAFHEDSRVYSFVFSMTNKNGNFTNGTHSPRFFKLVVPFTMSAVQYATYYGDKTVKLPAGLTANVGEIDAQKHMLKLTPIGNVVPANTAVIITGAAGNYTLNVSTEAGSVPAKNDLKGSLTEIPATTVSSASVAYYAMGYNTEAQKVSFGLVEGTSIPAGKAYIEISKTAGAAPELLGDFLISSVQHVQRDTDSATIYDLNGRKVTQPVSGQLYVRNGKKFIYLR